MKPKTLLLNALVVSSALLSTGCFGLLERDFNKLTLVGELRLGDLEVFRRTVNLPSGNAQLILAVPNYRCSAIGDYPISFTVRSEKGVEFSERVLISQLTWSYAENSCDAFGYLRPGAAPNQSIPGHGTMTLEITRDQSPVTVEVDASEMKTSSSRSASIWFIYGGRAPLGRIFGGQDKTGK